MLEDLVQLETEVTRALRGLDASQTQAAPPNQLDKWSIQEIVQHLLLTYRSTIPVIQARLDKRSPTRARPSLRQQVVRLVILGTRRFPQGRVAPREVTPTLPSPVADGAELAAKVHAELARLAPLLTAGEHIFGRQRAASHLVLGPLSMQQWARFHLIHGRHHIRQIYAIRRAHRF